MPAVCQGSLGLTVDQVVAIYTRYASTPTHYTDAVLSTGLVGGIVGGLGGALLLVILIMTVLIILLVVNKRSSSKNINTDTTGEVQ